MKRGLFSSNLKRDFKLFLTRTNQGTPMTSRCCLYGVKGGFANVKMIRNWKFVGDLC